MRGDRSVRLRGALRLLPLLACLTPPVAAMAWQPLGPPPTDTRDAWRPVVQGRLSNGLRYAVLPREPNEAGVGLLFGDTLKARPCAL